MSLIVFIFLSVFFFLLLLLRGDFMCLLLAMQKPGDNNLLAGPCGNSMHAFLIQIKFVELYSIVVFTHFLLQILVNKFLS